MRGLTFARLRLCKSLIRKLLLKDEGRRLGSRAGAADVKTHPFFRPTQWALLRHSTPPMIPRRPPGAATANPNHPGGAGAAAHGGAKAGEDASALNFRPVKESAGSADLGGRSEGSAGGAGGAAAVAATGGGIFAPPRAPHLPGVPLDSGLRTPGGEVAGEGAVVLADPFEEFNSVTLHHDGEEHHGGGHREEERGVAR